jgi:hypothetical protein
MHPDPGCYQERYPLTRGIKLGLAAWLVSVALGLLAHVGLPVLVTFLAVSLIGALLPVIGPARRRIAFRAVCRAKTRTGALGWCFCDR